MRGISERMSGSSHIQYIFKIKLLKIEMPNSLHIMCDNETKTNTGTHFMIIFFIRVVYNYIFIRWARARSAREVQQTQSNTNMVCQVQMKVNSNVINGVCIERTPLLAAIERAWYGCVLRTQLSIVNSDKPIYLIRWTFAFLMMCKMFECVKFTRTECGQQSHQNLNYFINCNITFGHWAAAAAAKLDRTTEKKTLHMLFARTQWLRVHVACVLRSLVFRCKLPQF